jgi:hypothetical protein
VHRVPALAAVTTRAPAVLAGPAGRLACIRTDLPELAQRVRETGVKID